MADGLDQELLWRLEALAAAPDTDFGAMLESAGLDPRTDLVGADLAGLELLGANLSGANLMRCDLAGTVPGPSGSLKT